MKSATYILRCLLLINMIILLNSQTLHAQFLKDLGQQAKQSAEQSTSNQASTDAANTTDSVLTKGQRGVVNLFKGKKKNKDQQPATTQQQPLTQQQPPSNTSNTVNNTTAAAVATGSTIATYQNYDFVPGDSIVFYDDFTEDQDGEFPSHWDLQKGQGVVNKVSNDPAFFLTEGNYAVVDPLMKTNSYLSSTFTVEFDYMVKDGGGDGIICFLNYKDKDGNDETANINYNEHGEVSTGYFPRDFNANFPGTGSDDDYYGKWHHCALIMKDNQLKFYLDQYRVLVMPNVGIAPLSVALGGIGSQDEPIIFRNVRIANGGNMNVIGQKFTESKIVTHGITFDIDQSVIKPESMGTLNMIAGIMKSNPGLKFEIDGHTDNTGDPAHNLTLSQQRADAVAAQLETMGIDASRLTTKGFGDTKPIDTNDTPEGRANNRRVEFLKM